MNNVQGDSAKKRVTTISKLLENELKKKNHLIAEGDRRHNTLLEKIQQLENRLENIDGKNQAINQPNPVVNSISP